MENWGLRIQHWGWRAVDWGWEIKISGFHHATPTFDKHISGHHLSQITLFWWHCKILNFPLEDDLQVFPGLLWSGNKYIKLEFLAWLNSPISDLWFILKNGDNNKNENEKKTKKGVQPSKIVLLLCCHVFPGSSLDVAIIVWTIVSLPDNKILSHSLSDSPVWYRGMSLSWCHYPINYRPITQRITRHDWKMILTENIVCSSSY